MQVFLSPQQAESLLWSRFVGVIGHNILGYLCLEHLNRLCKRAVNDKSSNKSEKAFTFVGKILGVLKPVLDQFDTQNGVSSNKDRDVLINHLQTLCVFSHHDHRKHPSFPKPKNVLCIRNAEFIDWMEQHIK